MTLKNYEDEITQLSKSEEAMLANIFELTELKYVLIETERLLDNVFFFFFQIILSFISIN